MIYYIGTGLFLGIVTLMDEGLELALGFHAANNLFTALLVTADWTAFKTYSIFKDMSDPTEATFVDTDSPPLGQRRGISMIASSSARAVSGSTTLIVCIPNALAGLRLIPRSSRKTHSLGSTSRRSHAIS